MNDNDKIVNELVEQLSWWKYTGWISSIDKDAIEEAIDFLYPNGILKFSPEQIDNLVFRVMMAI